MMECSLNTYTHFIAFKPYISPVYMHCLVTDEFTLFWCFCIVRAVSFVKFPFVYMLNMPQIVPMFAHHVIFVQSRRKVVIDFLCNIQILQILIYAFTCYRNSVFVSTCTLPFVLCLYIACDLSICAHIKGTTFSISPAVTLKL